MKEKLLYITYYDDHELEKIVDASDATLLDRSKSEGNTNEGIKKLALLCSLSRFGEIFCYKKAQNSLKISYRAWDSQKQESHLKD